VDRNAAVGTVLIFVILMVWMWMLTPPPPHTEGAGQDAPVTDTAEVAQQRQLPPPELDRRTREELPAVADTSIAAATEGQDRSIVVETDLYRAVFATRGGTLRSFQLKEYQKFDQVTPVEMVDTTRAGALGILFTTPTNHLADTRAFHFEPDTDLDLIQVTDGPATLSFEARIGEGSIRQTYTFTPGEYEVGLQVAKTQEHTFQTSEGYEIAWFGGIPFTEGDVEEEAQRSGAFVRSGGEVESVNLQRRPEDTRRFIGEVSWIAVKNKYFASIILPNGGTRGAELDGEQLGSAEDGTLFEDYTARLMMVPAGGGVQNFRLYLGPMEYFRLAGYRERLYDMVDFGWNFFEWMTRPLAKYVFIPSFTFLSNFIPNYGIVIILFAILLKLVLYPLTKTSYKSMARMRELQPKMEAIKEKFKDNPQKQQEAMMKMYKETGVNPLGGCLPMLMQYPIIIALWQFLPQAIEMRQKSFLWANDLSAPDIILDLPFTIPFYGNFVAGFTLLMGISMVVQMKVQMMPQTNPQMKMFTYIFPVMIFAIFNRLASGLSLYYLIYNVVTAVQQKWINMRIESGKTDPGEGETSPSAPAKKGRPTPRGKTPRKGKKVRS
jgi:YidC/Oxa1 family membrane protein insertase